MQPRRAPDRVFLGTQRAGALHQEPQERQSPENLEPPGRVTALGRAPSRPRPIVAFGTPRKCNRKTGRQEAGMDLAFNPIPASRPPVASPGFPKEISRPSRARSERRP